VAVTPEVPACPSREPAPISDGAWRGPSRTPTPTSSNARCSTARHRLAFETPQPRNSGDHAILTHEKMRWMGEETRPVIAAQTDRIDALIEPLEPRIVLECREKERVCRDLIAGKRSLRSGC